MTTTAATTTATTAAALADALAALRVADSVRYRASCTADHAAHVAALDAYGAAYNVWAAARAAHLAAVA